MFSVGYEVWEDACETGIYVAAEYFVFESFVSNFVKNFGNVTKDYVSAVFFLCVRYGFMEVGQDSVRS